MAESVFERHELKYLLDSRQRRALELALRGRMREDSYGESTICSLYYDTPDSRLIRRSLEKPDYKEKLRVRSYGRAEPDSTVFVELKKKVSGVVYKRRVAVTQKEAAFHLAHPWLAGRDPVWESQIGREIDWALRYYRTLSPAMVLCYDRVAWFCPEDPQLRVTFDRNIRWRSDALSLCEAPTGEALLCPGRSLLEIKTGSAIPLWLARTMRANGILQTSFSKYGTAYTLTQQKKWDEQRQPA